MSISFFVRCDLNGLVEDTYWSDPVSIAIPAVTNVRKLLDPAGQSHFLSILSNVLETGKDNVCQQVNISGGKTKMCMIIVQRDRNLWVLAIEDKMDIPSIQRDYCIGLFQKMINYVASTYTQHQFQNTQTVYEHFEQIQRLNNELVNTHRELLRAHNRLEILNEDLNNRLVKDPLTSLVSRYQYRSEISRLITAHPKTLGVFAFIDIDNFKQVNDTYGHGVGDEYLIEFSKRLSLVTLGYQCIHMRIAGDEFGLYMHGIDDVPETFTATFWEEASKVLSSKPIQTKSGPLPVSCSIGLAVYNRDTTNVYELIEYADRAMYLAKHSGKFACRMFDSSE